MLHKYRQQSSRLVECLEALFELRKKNIPFDYFCGAAAGASSLF